jgi:hypothetical protein
MNNFKNKAKKIIDDGKICIYDFFNIYNGILIKEKAIRYFTLCFFPDHKIKFVESDTLSMFGPSDIMFNGNIIIGISKDIKKDEIKWKKLQDIIEKELIKRDLLTKKSVNKMFDIPFNCSVRNFLIDNFSENVIIAKSELEEYNNTQTGALYKYFLDENDQLKKDFFKELKLLYKKNIKAEI